MKRIAVCIAMFLSLHSHLLAAPDNKAINFDMSAVPVSEVLRAIFSDALKTPYVMAPEVLQDQRLVSFRFGSSKGDVRADLVRFLDAVGYTLTTRGGIDFIEPRRAEQETEKEVFIYRPRYREVSYLADMLRPLFRGQFTINRTFQLPSGDKPTSPAPPGSAAALIDRDSDALVWQGPAAELPKLEKLLKQVDVAQGGVMVRGVVYEFSTSDKNASAFQAAMSLMGGKLSFGLQSASTPADNFIRFKSTSIDAVLSMLSSDSRFKVLSSPSLRVRSGASARFVAGQEVPVLGSLSYPQGAGQAVQSVEYRSSGVIFDLKPKVRDAAIDLDVSQQLSDFIPTTTGVNNSPTLIKREVRTALSMEDGDIVVMGGLTESKESADASGFPFLPSFLRSKSETNSKTEVLLILQLTKI